MKHNMDKATGACLRCGILRGQFFPGASCIIDASNVIPITHLIAAKRSVEFGQDEILSEFVDKEPA